jgi:hypothetical protein
MSKKAVLFVSVLFCISCLLRDAKAQDKCADILKGGIFNTVTINKSEGIKNDYTTWQCTTEFKTHMEAYEAGVSVGFPVYGIPIQLGLSFDSTQRDNWKKDHCSATIDKSMYSSAYQKVVSSVSEGVVAAWRDCMIASFDQKIGLTSIAQSRGQKQVVMKVRWRPYDGFDTRLPKVTGFSMVGAKQATVGSTLFAIDKEVPATETIIDFTRDSARNAVTLTLNTDRGSVTAYVPSQKMSILVDAVFNPTIETRKVATKDYAFYQHTPGNDCVADLNFDQDYHPTDGYTFTSYSFEETTKAGKRTSYSSNTISNGVHFHMHVQGDDGAFGFCESHGWLGLKIHVTGQKWDRVPMTVWNSGEVKGSPLQETVLIHYPYLQPTTDVKNFKLKFVATVKKIIGDDVITVQLTDGATTASGLEAKTDDSGNLIIDGSKAFSDWRAGLAGVDPSALTVPTHTVNPTSAPADNAVGQPAALSQPTDLVYSKAEQACKAKNPKYEVYSVKATSTPGLFNIVCGNLPSAVHLGTEPQQAEIIQLNLNK